MSTNPTHEAIGRLRAEVARVPGDGSAAFVFIASEDRDLILSLLDQTREALEPFAEACQYLHPALPDDGETLDGLKVSDFRKAAALLAQMEKPS